MTQQYTEKILRASSNIIDEWNARNWEDYLDDNYYFSKGNLAKTKWNKFDKDLFIEAGTFEWTLIKEIGVKKYQNEVKSLVYSECVRIANTIKSNDILTDECLIMMCELIKYLLVWAPTDCYSERARRVISAFPKQGIVVGFVKNDLFGQMSVYRPKLNIMKLG